MESPQMFRIFIRATVLAFIYTLGISVGAALGMFLLMYLLPWKILAFWSVFLAVPWAFSPIRPSTKAKMLWGVWAATLAGIIWVLFVLYPEANFDEAMAEMMPFWTTFIKIPVVLCALDALTCLSWSQFQIKTGKWT